jgi:ATP-dependent Clp protease ATP-binding subunit ClpA
MPAPAATASLVLTDRAREALGLAAQEARRFDSPYVGTEHLLLGLVLKGTGPAAAALFGSGVTLDGVREEVLADWAARKDVTQSDRRTR